MLKNKRISARFHGRRWPFIRLRESEVRLQQVRELAKEVVANPVDRDAVVLAKKILSLIP